LKDFVANQPNASYHTVLNVAHKLTATIGDDQMMHVFDSLISDGNYPEIKYVGNTHLTASVVEMAEMAAKGSDIIINMCDAMRANVPTRVIELKNELEALAPQITQCIINHENVYGDARSKYLEEVSEIADKQKKLSKLQEDKEKQKQKEITDMCKEGDRKVEEKMQAQNTAMADLVASIETERAFELSNVNEKYDRKLADQKAALHSRHEAERRHEQDKETKQRDKIIKKPASPEVVNMKSELATAIDHAEKTNEECIGKSLASMGFKGALNRISDRMELEMAHLIGTQDMLDEANAKLKKKEDELAQEREAHTIEQQKSTDDISEMRENLTKMQDAIDSNALDHMLN